MNTQERLARIEDALVDLAVLVTEGDLSRNNDHLNRRVNLASHRMVHFATEVRLERTA